MQATAACHPSASRQPEFHGPRPAPCVLSYRTRFAHRSNGRTAPPLAGLPISTYSPTRLPASRAKEVHARGFARQRLRLAGSYLWPTCHMCISSERVRVLRTRRLRREDSACPRSQIGRLTGTRSHNPVMYQERALQLERLTGLSPPLIGEVTVRPFGLSICIHSDPYVCLCCCCCCL